VSCFTAAPARAWHKRAGGGPDGPRRNVCDRCAAKEETTMTKIILALALTIAALAAVPASANPNCVEDLGYGRTGSFGCGG
jgi:hypothetical protein